MSIKRWVLLILAGTVLTGVGVAMAVVFTYRYAPFPEQVSGLVSALTLQFLPRWLRIALLVPTGIAMMLYGFWRLSRSIISPFIDRSGDDRELVDIVAEHRFGAAHPEVNVVTVGGGTGLSSLLRGLKKHDLALTAIVTVADDGGSTGRIRSEFDIPAPGDIRNCLAALADDESLVSRLFQYRFDRQASQLAGHSFGNLFITALAQVTGSFEQAVIESATVLNIRGRVLPSTLSNVHLCAELTDGTIVRGESRIEHKHAPIARMFLEPEQCPVYEPAFGALLNADLIVLGPGSLYTSVVPNLLVDGISQAVRWSPARVVYVCNVATQPGETDGFSAADHVRVIQELLGPGVIDDVLVNSNPASAQAIGPDVPIEPVLPGSLYEMDRDFRIVERDIVSDRNPLRHDPDKLSAALLELALEPKQPMVPVRGARTLPAAARSAAALTL